MNMLLNGNYVHFLNMRMRKNRGDGIPAKCVCAFFGTEKIRIAFIVYVTSFVHYNHDRKFFEGDFDLRK